MTRDDVVAAARRWIGTPYKHQASVRGVGCDCIGLVRGVWRELYGAQPETGPEDYSRFWAEEKGHELLMHYADKYLVKRDHEPLRHGGEFAHGDVILMRMMRNGPAKHAAITTRDGTMIHAYSTVPFVLESPSTPDWCFKIAAAYSFPGVG
jgi:NlpC/P60 family putative phage cell wall peptidase